MKVLLVNGSPHKNGCTYVALKEIANIRNAGYIRQILEYGAWTKC